jgi:4-amino-4-deoxy-L-arabinose transferase-like glycosyltransferase
MITEAHSPSAVRPNRLLVLLWIAFLIRGVWYCGLLPAWEGYDEPYHFAALQQVASGRGVPHSDTRISLEVQRSLHLLPLPWMLQFHGILQPLTVHEDFWKLPPAERERRVDAVHALDPREGSQSASEPILNYESQQVPLYYWLFGVPLRWMSSASLLSRVYLLRLLSLLLASAAIPMAYEIAKLVFGSEAPALGVTAVIALMPELMINVARVGNDSLALVFYTAMLAAGLQAMNRPSSWRWWLLMGAALGCGLLSKAYVLSAVPGIFAVAGACLWRTHSTPRQAPTRTSIAARLAAALAIAAAIAGPWYFRIHRATGSWTGVATDAAQGNLSLARKLSAATHVNWRSGLVSIVLSHVWFGDWSFLRISDRLYKLAFIVITAAIGGVVFRLLRSRTPANQRRNICVLSIFYLGFWIGLLYHVLVTFLTLGVSASAGWYLYATVAAEIVLLVWGLQAFLPARTIFRTLSVCLGVLDLYTVVALLMPYYAGLTAHLGERVPPALWGTISHLPVAFDRLSQLRPPWMGAPVLLASWISYCGATAGIVLAVFRLFPDTPSQA